MTRTRVYTAAVLSTLALAALTGCGGDDKQESAKDGGSQPPSATPEPTQSSGPDDFGCLKGGQLAGSTTFKLPEGDEVGAYHTGKGKTGVILSHQANLDLCSWVPKADELAADGYQALAINSMNWEVDELVAGAALLREKGATKIILIGTSKGGTGSLAAAAVIEPAVAAAVSISGPADYGDIDALAAVSKLTMPVYVIAGRDDTRFFEDAQKLDKAATASKGKKYEIVNAPDHGNYLLDEYPAVWEHVKAFIKKYGA